MPFRVRHDHSSRRWQSQVQSYLTLLEDGQLVCFDTNRELAKTEKIPSATNVCVVATLCRFVQCIAYAIQQMFITH
jgi:hypothetical protein